MRLCGDVYLRVEEREKVRKKGREVGGGETNKKTREKKRVGKSERALRACSLSERARHEKRHPSSLWCERERRGMFSLFHTRERRGIFSRVSLSLTESTLAEHAHIPLRDEGYVFSFSW